MWAACMPWAVRESSLAPLPSTDMGRTFEQLAENTRWVLT